MKGVGGETEENKGGSTCVPAADRILRSVFPIILRLVLTRILRFVLSEVTWIKGMRHELIFTWQALNAYNHANTSCG